MKKLLSILLIAAMAAASLAVPASAATVGYTVDVSGTITHTAAAGETKEHYTATYSGDKLTAGNQYVLLVVKLDSDWNADSVLDSDDYTVGEAYIKDIRQAAAAGDTASVSFDFMPSSVPDSVVLLGGVFNGVASPIILGRLIGQGVTVSGKVIYQESSQPATIVLKSGDNIIDTKYTATSGTAIPGTTLFSYEYSLFAPEESGYSIFVTKPSYCAYTKTGVTITSGTALPDINISAVAGDLDGVDGVEAFDLNTLISDFGVDDSAIWNSANSDIDRDGSVNAFDLGALLASFGNAAIID